MQKQLIALLLITSLVFGSWGITKLTDNIPMATRTSLKVSPDGKYIASLGMRQSHPYMLLLTDVQTGNEQIVAYLYGSELSWSADSKNILFRSDTTLYNFNMDSVEVTPLLNAKCGVYSPVGNKLAYLKDSTIYVRDLATQKDTLISSFYNNSLGSLDWAQNSADFLYFTKYNYIDDKLHLFSADLKKHNIRKIYANFSPFKNQVFDDYQYKSFIQNGEENVLIAKCNPHNGNEKDSVLIYRSEDDSVSLLVEKHNQYSWNTGFLAPKWSPDGTSFTAQYGTELIDDGCAHTVVVYNVQTDSLFEIIPGYEQSFAHEVFTFFMNPVYLDTNRIVFFGFDMQNLDRKQNEIFIADKTVSIAENVLDSKKVSITNYPNPFNNSTVINYALPTASSINLAIYNAKGELVKNLYTGHQSAGRHASTFNASGLNSGVYIISLNGEKLNVNKKVLLIK